MPVIDYSPTETAVLSAYGPAWAWYANESITAGTTVLTAPALSQTVSAPAIAQTLAAPTIDQTLTVEAEPR